MTASRKRQPRPTGIAAPVTSRGNPASVAPAEPETATAGDPAAQAQETEQQSRPAPRSGGKKGARKAVSAPESSAAIESPTGATDAAEGKPEDRARPQVLVPDSTATGARVSLILHPDDDRLLKEKRIEDRGDANTRIRALLAVYRSNARLQAQVDRLTRSAPRGPSGRQ